MTRREHVAVVVVAAISAGVGCVDVSVRMNEHAHQAVVARTKFELSCNEPKITEINPIHLQGHAWVGTYGVSECGGQRAVYIVTCSGECTAILDSERK